MDTTSKKIVWAFAVLGILSVALTFYTSVMLEEFAVVYCDEDGVCSETMPEEWLEEDVAEETSVVLPGLEMSNVDEEVDVTASTSEIELENPDNAL